MKIYLMRHGLTEWNKVWRLQGRTDIALAEEGVQQAKEAGQKLKVIPFDKVLSSPLSRAKVTAEIIAEGHTINGKPLEVEVDERLIELGFGIHEGMTEENDPALENRIHLLKDPVKYVPLDGAESYEQLDARCRSFLEDLKKLEGKCEHVLIVGHGALDKGIIRAVLNADLKDFWDFPWIDNCGYAVIDCTDGYFSMAPEYEVYRVHHQF